MNGSLFDTNITSYLFKNDPLCTPYLPHIAGRRCLISFITLAELRFWEEKNQWGAPKRAALEKHLQRFGVLSFNKKTIGEYVRIRRHRENIGRPVQFEDLWIAATAIAYDLPLLSHNRKDFEDIPGLNLICFQ